MLPALQTVIFVAAAAFSTVAAAASPHQSHFSTSLPFFNPAAGGGSSLDNAGDGLGEPLNVIVSGLSSPSVLTDDGFLNFAQSLGFSFECLDLHIGAPQSANLGDGNGWVNQTTELRMDFGAPDIGTCLESLLGGNHLRMFRQNGSLADTEALFLAVSKEENVEEGHTIAPNGYNLGRDLLVQAATSKVTRREGVRYRTTAENVTGLLPIGSAGVNHGIALDGIVSVLTVHIVEGYGWP